MAKIMEPGKSSVGLGWRKSGILNSLSLCAVVLLDRTEEK
jgi:hypothetical protein